MKAPEPVFTSRISAPRPAASFFDRIEAVISEMDLDRAGDVADGVERLVGRREVGGLADNGAAGLLHHVAEQRVVRLRSGSRGWSRTCRACRRYGRGRGPRSSAHRCRTAARIGASIRRDIVADAAGRVLVGHRAIEIGPIEHGAAIAHGVGERDALIHAHVAEDRPPWRSAAACACDTAAFGKAGDEAGGYLPWEAFRRCAS